LGKKQVSEKITLLRHVFGLFFLHLAISCTACPYEDGTESGFAERRLDFFPLFLPCYRFS
jgi:gamma-glutamyl:cysteine ligase YbdK (ATP-grasp superfamily)